MSWLAVAGEHWQTTVGHFLPAARHGGEVTSAEITVEFLTGRNMPSKSPLLIFLGNGELLTNEIGVFGD